MQKTGSNYLMFFHDIDWKRLRILQQNLDQPASRIIRQAVKEYYWKNRRGDPVELRARWVAEHPKKVGEDEL